MGNSQEITRKEANIQAYKDLLLHPGWITEPKSALAKALGLTPKTLYRYDEEIDWEWVRDERRKRFAASITQVDAAVLRKAEQGNIPAAELAYKRFDGYVPKSALDVGTKTDEELIDAAKTIERELASGKECDLPGNGEASAG